MSDVLQELKEIMIDDSFKISLALVERVHIAEDLTSLRVECLTMPDSYSIIAEVGSDAIGGGSITLPNKDDLVLIAFTDEDQKAVIIKRLYSNDDKLPKQAVTGDTVLESLVTKKLWLSSKNRINLSKDDVEPTENLVLGQIFKAFASDLLTIQSTQLQSNSEHAHVGNLGAIVTPNDKATDDLTAKADIDQLKASPIDNSEILSDLSYTS